MCVLRSMVSVYVGGGGVDVGADAREVYLCVLGGGRRRAPMHFDLTHSICMHDQH